MNTQPGKWYVVGWPSLTQTVHGGTIIANNFESYEQAQVYADALNYVTQVIYCPTREEWIARQSQEAMEGWLAAHYAKVVEAVRDSPLRDAFDEKRKKVEESLNAYVDEKGEFWTYN